MYNDNLNIIGVNINGTDYFYEKNSQNDITQIVDSEGNVVVEYTYDPWGKIESVTGELADTVGYLNPIRYRSYYYDNETDLYYLLSRYYDPETGRFINADDFNYLVCDNNLFKYCNNDPVNFIDSNGHLSWNGGSPVINSGADYQEYEALISTAMKQLKSLGFTGMDRGKTFYNTHGAAHPNNISFTINFDLNQNKPLRLYDMVVIEDNFLEKVHGAIKSQLDQEGLEIYERFSVNELYKQIYDTNQGFYTQDGKLYIRFSITAGSQHHEYISFNI